LEYQLLLSTSLDIFEARLPHKTADQDFGLLQAVDERLAMYGWLTNTGVKLVIVVDMEGRTANAQDTKVTPAVGLRDADMKPVSVKCVLDDSTNVRWRPSEHYKQPTSCSCEIHSTALMSIRQSQRMKSRELDRLKSRVESSYKKSRGSPTHGLLALRPSEQIHQIRLALYHSA
jgi:hypothetical protein